MLAFFVYHTTLIAASHSSMDDMRFGEPEFFGAIGNGLTDDTDAIRKCISIYNRVHLSAGKVYKSKLIEIKKNVEFFGGGVLLHSEMVTDKDDVSSTGHRFVSLIKITNDAKFVAKDIVFDGNQNDNPCLTITGSWPNFIWCCHGSMELYGCTIKNTAGHAVRTGNVDDFNPKLFAHDIVISNCTILQKEQESSCGDAMRIERTKKAIISKNLVSGGWSGIRCQLYCSDLTIENNIVRNSGSDVGITAACSENVTIKGNECFGHFQHGIEIDAVCDCLCEDNYVHDNKKSGIFCCDYGTGKVKMSSYRGTISTKYKKLGYGYQDFGTSSLPNHNTIIRGNRSENNGCGDVLLGQNGLLYEGNYLNNPKHLDKDYVSQLYIGPGNIGKTSVQIIGNTFVCSDEDKYAIHFSSYYFTSSGHSNVFLNTSRIGNVSLLGEGSIDSNVFSIGVESCKITNNIKVTSDKALAIEPDMDDIVELGQFYDSPKGYKAIKIRMKATKKIPVVLNIKAIDTDGIIVKNLLQSKTLYLTKDYKDYVIYFNDDTKIDVRYHVFLSVLAGASCYVENLSFYGQSVVKKEM